MGKKFFTAIFCKYSLKFGEYTIMSDQELTQDAKKFWQSKTVWVNLIAAAAAAIQYKTGFIVDAEQQFMVLTLVNLVLRSITDTKIEWRV